MHDLFFGTGIGHTILLLAFVIGTGLLLGKIRVRGVSIGSTWILFVGIFVSHFGFRADPEILHFVKEAGLILFVFSIGLQVGPGFFHSFRRGGVLMNLLAVLMILLAVGCTFGLSTLTGEGLPTMVGVMSGAVTNTPGLGAAQQTWLDVTGAPCSSTLASAYAVTYPIGVLGAIGIVILLKGLFRIDLSAERKALDAEGSAGDGARRMHVEVENPAIFGRRLSDVVNEFHGEFVVSRILHADEISAPTPDTVLQQGDRLLLVISEKDVDMLRILFGKEVPMHVADWKERDHHHHMVVRRITVTKSSMTGKTLRDLAIRARYGISVTRIIRSGVELVARPDLYIQMGDGLMCVGPEKGIEDLARIVGNSNDALNRPNLIPVFLGIVLGVICGSIPIHFPGIPQPIKLGLAGGPLIIAILLGYFGPRWKITTYTTASASLMLREIGISLFLAAVGLGAGEHFVSAIAGGGYWWILYGAVITLVPLLVTGVVGRLFCHLNFYQICGLLSGGMTDAVVLDFAQNAYGSDQPSVHYATVYPLSMFLRVLAAQLLILVSFT